MTGSDRVVRLSLIHISLLHDGFDKAALDTADLPGSVVINGKIAFSERTPASVSYTHLFDLVPGYGSKGKGEIDHPLLQVFFDFSVGFCVDQAEFDISVAVEKLVEEMRQKAQGHGAY